MIREDEIVLLNVLGRLRSIRKETWRYLPLYRQRNLHKLLLASETEIDAMLKRYGK